jgi:hypothetical protein
MRRAAGSIEKSRDTDRMEKYELNVAYTRNERDSLDACGATRSKISLTNKFRIAIAFLEILVSGCTCLSDVFI